MHSWLEKMGNSFSSRRRFDIDAPNITAIMRGVVVLRVDVLTRS